MRKLTSLLGVDIKNIFRDKTLVFMLFIPLILVFVLQQLLPVLNSNIPEVIPYNFLIVCSFCIISSLFPAFIISMIMLDEKDENVWQMMKIVPLSLAEFMIYRLSFMTLLGFLAAFIILMFSGTTTYSLLKILLLSFQMALIAPVVSLIIITWAKNKVEGMTWFKGINFISMISAVAFFVDKQWEYFFGFVPFYWIFKSFEALETEGNFILNLLIGCGYFLLLLYMLYKKFGKVFRN